MCNSVDNQIDSVYWLYSYMWHMNYEKTIFKRIPEFYNMYHQLIIILKYMHDYFFNYRGMKGRTICDITRQSGRRRPRYPHVQTCRYQDTHTYKHVGFMLGSAYTRQQKGDRIKTTLYIKPHYSNNRFHVGGTCRL